MARGNRRETLLSRTDVKSSPLLHDSSLRSVFLRLEMGLSNVLHILPSPNLVSMQGETLDPVELSRGISDVAVKCPPSYTKL